MKATVTLPSNFFKPYVKETKRYMEDEVKKYGARILNMVWQSKDFIRLMGNENQYGPSPKVVEAIKNAAQWVNRYPSPIYVDLIEKIAEYASVKPENILLGAGSLEIMDAIFRAFLDPGDNVILSAPTYKPYVLRIKICGGVPRLIPMRKNENGFSRDMRKILQALDSQTKAIVFLNPNNPTGIPLTEEELEKVLDKPVLIVIDEAYYEFCGKTFVPFVEENENAIVIRTLSKAFALAGLRLGYAIANPSLVDYVSRVQLPFRVTELTAHAALAALNDMEYAEKTIKKITEERERLFSELSKIEGLKPYPSAANFILVKITHKKYSAEKISSLLLGKRIIVRGFTGAPGLGDGGYIRISVGTREQNDKLISALKSILGGG